MSLLGRFKKSTDPEKQRLPKVLRAMESLLVEQRQSDLERDRDLDWEYEHMREAIRYAKMLAIRRKLDPELAACALAVQNIGRITSGKTEGHAEAGYTPARRLLVALGCFTPAEVEQLATSVRNHSRKERTDSALDEMAKDVDTYVRYAQGHEVTGPHELCRLSTVMLELQRKMD